MRCFHDAVPRRNRSAVHALYTEQLESPDATNDVENGVYGPNLVKVYAIHRRRVQRRFLFGNHGECPIRAFFHLLRQWRPLYDFANLPQMAAVRLWRNVEVDLLAGDL